MHQHHDRENPSCTTVTSADNEALVGALPMEIVAGFVDPSSGFSISEAWVGERDGWLTPRDVAEIERCAVAAFLNRERPVA